MTNAEIVIAVATFAGPIMAVQVQKFIERAQARRQRKLGLFYALMTNRGGPMTPTAVQAVNMIEIEFNRTPLLGFKRQTDSEAAVMTAWTAFFAHLNAP